MLQPLQLQDVSLRYPTEIAELQDFFQKAGCMPGPDALHSVTLRLVQERAFHRDLTSHLWVLVYTHHLNISYADLLGILAIAAAGIQAAANADEEDAHGLLGYLMEARESFDATRSHSGIHAAQPASAVAAAVPAPAPAPAPQAVTPPPQTVVAPTALPQLARSETIAEPTMLQRKPAALLTEVSQQEAEKPPHSRKRLLWVAACVLATLAAGLEVYHLSAPARTGSSAPAVAPSSPAIAARAVVPTEPAAPVAETRPSFSRKTSPATPAPVSGVRSTASAPPAISQPRNSEPPPAVPASKPSTSAAAVEPSTATRATTNASVTAAAPPPRTSPAPIIRTPPVARSASNTPASHAGPVSSLSRIRPVPIPRAALAPAPPSRTAPSAAAVHLDRPPAYTDSPGSDLNSTVRTHPAPRLVRRTPEEKAEMLASTGYAKLQASPSSPTAAAPAVPRGNVRGESVGAYASHVVYDPTPDYPAAAAAAHVQGEVKLESEVDADGNVTSVRVVSGPPQLRAAALDAAQRWRYRPNVIGGRQMPMTTTTVFEFRLP